MKSASVSYSDRRYFGTTVAEDALRVAQSELERPSACPWPCRARREQSPAKDAVGPVLPLNAIGSEKAANFWARRADPAEREADPLATRVLNHGEAIVAPRGRADEFSWPRANPSSTAEDVELPDAVPVKAQTETNPW